MWSGCETESRSRSLWPNTDCLLAAKAKAVLSTPAPSVAKPCWSAPLRVRPPVAETARVNPPPTPAEAPTVSVSLVAPRSRSAE